MAFNISTMRPHVDSVLVTERELPTGVVYRNKDKIHDANFWHRFKVKNVGDTHRDDILLSLMKHVYPMDFLPTNFTKDGDNAYILARGCGVAVEKFCFDNLEVPNCINPNAPSFKLEVMIKFSTTSEIKINVAANLESVLSKRFKSVIKTLDLNMFYKDPDLTEFCPLSQPKIMYFVLHLARPLKPKRIILSNNGIKSLIPLETLVDVQIEFLDLSSNEIENVQALEPLKLLPTLRELYLDNNMLCSEFNESFNYCTQVKSYCPLLKTLDGIPVLQHLKGIKKPQKNFLCNLDSLNVVNSFVERYFTLFDSSQRRDVMEMYDQEAIFTMSFKCNAHQITSKAAYKHYNQISRNMKQLANMTKSTFGVFTGPTQIFGNGLAQIPPTEHDRYDLKVDVIYYQLPVIVLVVTGIFKHPMEAGAMQKPYFHFSRTFVLRETNDKVYIMNDLLHVQNAMTKQALAAFSIEDKTPIKYVAVTLDQKNEAIRTFALITTLTEAWAKKCLEDCAFDVKKALQVFIGLYKSNQIPDDAFANSRDDLTSASADFPESNDPIRLLNCDCSASSISSRCVSVDDSDDVNSLPTDATRDSDLVDRVRRDFSPSSDSSQCHLPPPVDDEESNILLGLLKERKPWSLAVRTVLFRYRPPGNKDQIQKLFSTTDGAKYWVNIPQSLGDCIKIEELPSGACPRVSREEDNVVRKILLLRDNLPENVSTLLFDVLRESGNSLSFRAKSGNGIKVSLAFEECDSLIVSWEEDEIASKAFANPFTAAVELKEQLLKFRPHGCDKDLTKLFCTRDGQKIRLTIPHFPTVNELTAYEEDQFAKKLMKMEPPYTDDILSVLMRFRPEGNEEEIRKGFKTLDGREIFVSIPLPRKEMIVNNDIIWVSDDDDVSVNQNEPLVANHKTDNEVNSEMDVVLNSNKLTELGMALEHNILANSNNELFSTPVNYDNEMEMAEGMTFVNLLSSHKETVDNNHNIWISDDDDVLDQNDTFVANNMTDNEVSNEIDVDLRENNLTESGMALEQNTPAESEVSHLEIDKVVSTSNEEMLTNADKNNSTISNSNSEFSVPIIFANEMEVAESKIFVSFPTPRKETVDKSDIIWVSDDDDAKSGMALEQNKTVESEMILEQNNEVMVPQLEMNQDVSTSSEQMLANTSPNSIKEQFSVLASSGREVEFAETFYQLPQIDCECFLNDGLEHDCLVLGENELLKVSEEEDKIARIVMKGCFSNNFVSFLYRRYRGTFNIKFRTKNGLMLFHRRPSNDPAYKSYDCLPWEIPLVEQYTDLNYEDTVALNILCNPNFLKTNMHALQAFRPNGVNKDMYKLLRTKRGYMFTIKLPPAEKVSSNIKIPDINGNEFLPCLDKEDETANILLSAPKPWTDGVYNLLYKYRPSGCVLHLHKMFCTQDGRKIIAQIPNTFNYKPMRSIPLLQTMIDDVCFFTESFSQEDRLFIFESDTVVPDREEQIAMAVIHNKISFTQKPPRQRFRSNAGFMVCGRPMSTLRGNLPKPSSNILTSLTELEDMIAQRIIRNPSILRGNLRFLTCLLPSQGYLHFLKRSYKLLRTKDGLMFCVRLNGKMKNRSGNDTTPLIEPDPVSDEEDQMAKLLLNSPRPWSHAINSQLYKYRPPRFDLHLHKLFRTKEGLKIIAHIPKSLSTGIL
ncbi:uncharacterized protein LOC109598395 isoform X2 [Aethina tumida]|uniref:uncharacterized protein LOC109598395 isoform X2 n=1 Tax=Aethina tumida TaxID=116153 RepID=UPI0021492135|nr:uncharacterized protein LOC109598395 isoform X2 [Aethina tumida]